MGEYNSVSWEEAYPDKELRESAQTYARFFREDEIKLRNEKRKEQALARSSLENLFT